MQLSDSDKELLQAVVWLEDHADVNLGEVDPHGLERHWPYLASCGATQFVYTGRHNLFTRDSDRFPDFPGRCLKPAEQDYINERLISAYRGWKNIEEGPFRREYAIEQFALAWGYLQVLDPFEES